MEGGGVDLSVGGWVEGERRTVSGVGGVGGGGKEGKCEGDVWRCAKGTGDCVWEVGRDPAAPLPTLPPTAFYGPVTPDLTNTLNGSTTRSSYKFITFY